MNGLGGLQNACPGENLAPLCQLLLTLVQTVWKFQCPLPSKNSYPENKRDLMKDNDEFDFIVVGGGSAGSIVASRLAENSKWKVLLLEAGEYPSVLSDIPGTFLNVINSKEDWQFYPEPNPNFSTSLKDGRASWPIGKMLGGSSGISPMLYLRGTKRDYDNWYKLGNLGWNYDSVLPYFKKIENNKQSMKNERFQSDSTTTQSKFGTEGTLSLTQALPDEPIYRHIFEAAKEVGVDVHDEEEALGYFPAFMTVCEGVRQSSSYAYIAQKPHKSNLFIATGIQVAKVIMKDSRCVGVVARKGEDLITLRAKKEVVLSAGAVNSPHILMNSGIGPKDHLKSMGAEPLIDLPVGQNLQNHIIFPGICIKLKSSTFRQEKVIYEIYNYLLHKNGSMASTSRLSLVGFINTKNDSNNPNIQLHHLMNERGDPVYKLILELFGLEGEMVNEILKAHQNSDILNVYPTLTNPKSKGKIELRSSNPFDPVKIYPNYLSNPEDLQTMYEAIQYLEKFLKTPSFSKLHDGIVKIPYAKCNDYKENSEDFWKCALKELTASMFHPVGTCKMGSGPEGVVDSKLRVKGVKSLRVIDASIMPNIVSVNTNGASMMIGERGVDFIKEEWIKEEL